MSFLHKNVVNLYISYKLNTSEIYLNTDFTLRNCLFGAVKLTKNVDQDNCRYNDHVTRFAFTVFMVRW